MDKSYILELKGVKKSFGGIHALKGVDFGLRRGEIHALLGENGAGKSTLIKIITGVYQADEGQYFLEGEPAAMHSPIDAKHYGITAIYQELSLIESLSVAENIFLGREPVFSALGLCRRNQIYDESQAYLNEFKIDIDCRKKVSELGMGQKRIVEIVKALATDSKILLLDEPTTGMSQAEIETLFKIMDMLKEKNVTMIYISHYLEEIFRVCTRATVFRDGRNIGVFQIGKVTEQELIQAMIGKEIRSSYIRRTRDFSEKKNILELRDYKTDKMKHAISMRVREGEIVGVTGIVGAGKSELAHSIFGNASYESGKMYVNGQEVHMKSPRDAKKHRMAFIPEDRKAESLFLKDTVANNMVIASLEHFRKWGGILDVGKKRKECLQMAEKLRVTPLNVDLEAGNLSGGNQQKVVIGKWLTANPELIIMDEPTRGIDVGAKTEIHELIRSLANGGKGMLVMSSEFEELIDLCDRILVLYKGRISGEVMPDEATNEKLLEMSLGG